MNDFEKSQKRWKNCSPTAGLTWGKVIDGDDFVSAVIDKIDINNKSVL